MPGEVSADHRRVVAAAFGQLAFMIAFARLGAFRLGMAQEQQSEHGFIAAFL